MLTIHDDFEEIFRVGLTGCLPRTSAYGNLPCASPLHETISLIPRSEWLKLIQQKEGRWLKDLCVAREIDCLDQNGLNYCHAYSTATAMQLEDYMQGGSLWNPAPTSIGGPITGWRNAGASLDADLQQASQHGCCSLEFLDKPYSLNSRAWKAGWEQDAALHRIEHWFDVDVPGRVFDAVVTCCLLDILCVVGFAWWSHAITGPYRIHDLGNGSFAGEYRNNWGMNWPSQGAGGWVVLKEGKGTPDLGAFAPRFVTDTERGITK